MELIDLKWENWNRYELSNGQYLRSNEFSGHKDDIVIHKNRAMLDRYYYFFIMFEPKTVFEMGVKEGGSLCLWYELLKCQVVGADIDVSQLSPQALRYMKGKDITVGSLDITGPEALPYVQRKFPNGIDLIIDDCLHTKIQIIQNFDTFYHRMLRPGGWYVIEDWEALHQEHRDFLLNFLHDLRTPFLVWHEMIRVYKRVNPI